MIFDLLAKIVTVIGLICFGSMTGAYNMSISFIILITAYFKAKYNSGEKLQILWNVMYMLFEGVYVIILLNTYAGISSILVFVTCSVTLICVWWLPPQKMRIVGGANSGLYMVYQLTIHNWTGLLELAVITSNFIAYRRERVLIKV